MYRPFTTDNNFRLPVVDFRHFASDGSQAQQLAVAKAIDQANREHGFVCLRNCGIDKDLLQSLFANSKNLFAGTPETKQNELKQLDRSTNTGYSGFGMEALNRKRTADMKEAFNCRKYSGENGDYVGTPKGFRETTEMFWKEMTRLGEQYSYCCALALGLDAEYFSKTIKKMDLCTLRMLHYPPCEQEFELDGDPNSSIRIGEHTDFGAFTFLFIDNFHDPSSLGLQVKPVSGGDLSSGSVLGKDSDVLDSDWRDVVFDDETLELIANDTSSAVIVNTGALMARWTADTWCATAHRVVVKPESRPHHRYSIAFFFDPDKEIVCSVHSKFVKEGDSPKYPPISSSDYLLLKLKEAQGVE